MSVNRSFNNLVQTMTRLPVEELQKLAFGPSSDMEWVEKFRDTPLLERAIDLTRSELQNSIAQQQQQQGNEKFWEINRQLDTQKKMLELELLELEAVESVSMGAGEQMPSDDTMVPKQAAYGFNSYNTVADQLINASKRSKTPSKIYEIAMKHPRMVGGAAGALGGAAVAAARGKKENESTGARYAKHMLAGATLGSLVGQAGRDLSIDHGIRKEISENDKFLNEYFRNSLKSKYPNYAPDTIETGVRVLRADFDKANPNHFGIKRSGGLITDAVKNFGRAVINTPQAIGKAFSGSSKQASGVFKLANTPVPGKLGLASKAWNYAKANPLVAGGLAGGALGGAHALLRSDPNDHRAKLDQVWSGMSAGAGLGGLAGGLAGGIHGATSGKGFMHGVGFRRMSPVPPGMHAPPAVRPPATQRWVPPQPHPQAPPANGYLQQALPIWPQPQGGNLSSTLRSGKPPSTLNMPPQPYQPQGGKPPSTLNMPPQPYQPQGGKPPSTLNMPPQPQFQPVPPPTSQKNYPPAGLPEWMGKPPQQQGTMLTGSKAPPQMSPTEFLAQAPPGKVRPPRSTQQPPPKSVPISIDTESLVDMPRFASIRY